MKKATYHRMNLSSLAIACIISMALLSLAIAFFIIKSFVVSFLFMVAIPAFLMMARIIDVKRIIGVVALIIFLSSCASPYYWGATATTHGSRAQSKYIKNQKGHNPHKRFHTNSSQPTFGAHDISKR